MHKLTKMLAAISVVVGILVLSMSPALAHAAFESSSPEDGAELAEVVAEVELTFAGVADPAGEGFVVLDGDGTVRAPTTVSTEDQLTYLLTFDPPLSGGEVGVRWSVAAPDAHPIDGSFTFTANAELPIEVTPAEADPGVEPGGEVPALEPDVEPDVADEGSGAASGVSNSVDSATPLDSGSSAATPEVSMEQFLDEPGAPNGVGVIAGFGRVLVLGGALVAIGGAVFAAFVIRGTKREFSMIVDSIRTAAWSIMAGAVIVLVSRLAVVNSGWTSMTFGTIREVVVSSFGVAVALKLLGGWMLSRAEVTVVSAGETADPVLSLHQLVPVGAGSIEAALPSEPIRPSEGDRVTRHDFVWRSHGDSLAVPIGAAVTLAAFLFDGHTVSEGSRLWTGVVDIVHVVAGAIWAGGLVMMAQVIWRRHRRGDDSRALELAVRFSVVAAIALTAAGLAGIALTFIILESISDIWTTSWGQLLMVKTVLVALAGMAGLYNHRVLIPKLGSGGDSATTAEAEFRRAVSVEGAIIGSVVVATALLVAASSV